MQRPNSSLLHLPTLAALAAGAGEAVAVAVAVVVVVVVGVVINSLSVSSENICENGKKKTLTRKEKRKVLLLFAASTFYRKR